MHTHTHTHTHTLIHRSGGPVDVDHFRTLLVESSCEKNEEKLMNSWFPQVTAMFSGEKALVTGPQRSRFYESVSTLIANQVSNLDADASIQYVYQYVNCLN